MTREEPNDMLIRRAQGGDREAFELLVERYRPRLLESIRRRFPKGAVRPDPLDVLQETLARALASIERFEWQGEDSLLRWLFGICRHVELDALRHARRVVSLDAVEERVSEDPSPSRSLRREERFERLRKAIEDLPPEYRDVLRLARLEGLKLEEVAERLGKSLASVKHLLARSLKLLRTKLDETGSLRLPPKSLKPGEERHGD